MDPSAANPLLSSPTHDSQPVDGATTNQDGDQNMTDRQPPAMSFDTHFNMPQQGASRHTSTQPEPQVPINGWIQPKMPPPFSKEERLKGVENFASWTSSRLALCSTHCSPLLTAFFAVQTGFRVNHGAHVLFLTTFITFNSAYLDGFLDNYHKRFVHRFDTTKHLRNFIISYNRNSVPERRVNVSHYVLLRWKR